MISWAVGKITANCLNSLLNICQRGNFPSGMLKIQKKEKVYGYYSTYNLGFVSTGCAARMAVQPKLGIWRQWDCWVPLTPGDPWLAVQVVLAMPKRWIIILLLTGVFLAACGTSRTDVPATQANPDLENVLPPDVALNVQNQISQNLGVAIENMKITNVEKMDWPNGCLGLPQGNEVCTEAITPGWLLTFNIDGKEYKYRVDKTGTVIRQEP